MKFDVAKALEKLRRHGWDLVNDNGEVKYRVIRKGILYVPKDLKEELDAHKKEVKAYVLGKPTRDFASRDSESEYGEPINDEGSPFDDPRVMAWVEKPPQITEWIWSKPC